MKWDQLDVDPKEFPNLQISTLSLASSPSIFRPFTQPFLIKNLKAGLEISSGTLSFTKTEIADTIGFFWFLGREGPYFV